MYDMYKGRVWWGNRYQFVVSGNQASVLGHGIEGALLVTEQVIRSVVLNDAASIQHYYSGGGGGGGGGGGVNKMGEGYIVETIMR